MNEAEIKHLNEMSALVADNPAYIGVMINQIIEAFKDKALIELHRANNAYLVMSILMGLILKRKNFTIPNDVKEMIECVLDKRSPCNAVIDFCERFDINIKDNVA